MATARCAVAGADIITAGAGAVVITTAGVAGTIAATITIMAGIVTGTTNARASVNHCPDGRVRVVKGTGRTATRLVPFAAVEDC